MNKSESTFVDVTSTKDRHKNRSSIKYIARRAFQKPFPEILFFDAHPFLELEIFRVLGNYQPLKNLQIFTKMSFCHSAKISFKCLKVPNENKCYGARCNWLLKSFYYTFTKVFSLMPETLGYFLEFFDSHALFYFVMSYLI